MVWQWLTSIPIIAQVYSLLKKYLDISERERKLTQEKEALLEKEETISRREEELSALLSIKEANINNIKDFIVVRADNINFLLISPQPAVEVQFLVENRSIFDLKMVKFLSKVRYQAQDIGELPAFVEEKTIGKQSGHGFMRRLQLSDAFANELSKKQQDKERSQWQFETHAYFSWEFEPFEKEQQVSISR